MNSCLILVESILPEGKSVVLPSTTAVSVTSAIVNLWTDQVSTEL